MSTIRPHVLGLALAGMMGLFHSAWAVLVLVGLAQPLLDFVFCLHMILPVYVISEFSPLTAVELILFTSLVGYVMGWILGDLWNRVIRSAHPPAA